MDWSKMEDPNKPKHHDYIDAEEAERIVKMVEAAKKKKLTFEEVPPDDTWR